MRSPALKTATVLGMTGQGETVAAAKADATSEILRILDADKREPEITEFRGHAALVFATGGWWVYKLICEPGLPLRSGPVNATTYAQWSRLEALSAARSHMAQNAWSHDEPDDAAFVAEAFPLAATAPGSHGARSAAELLSNCKWQRRYRAAIEAGALPNRAHEIASGLAPSQTGVVA